MLLHGHQWLKYKCGLFIYLFLFSGRGLYSGGLNGPEITVIILKLISPKIKAIRANTLPKHILNLNNLVLTGGGGWTEQECLLRLKLNYFLAQWEPKNCPAER